MTAIDTIQAPAPVPAVTSTWKAKLALTLLADTHPNLGGSGAPAAPRPPATPWSPALPEMDFPSLIAARLMMAARGTANRPKDLGRKSKKRG